MTFARGSLLAWSTLVALGLVSLAVRRHFWMLDFYYPIVVALGAISIAVGVGLVVLAKRRGMTLFAVIIALAIGQWWFTEQLILIAGFALTGFAP